MKKVNNKYIFLLGLILGLIFSITSVYAIEAYIESNKVSYDNHEGKITKKDNVQDSIDELYERSGIHKEKWIDPVLNGADPVLQEPLIPIEIKSNGDVYYANENSEWYNYSEKRWANAVILVDEPSNTNYGVGDHILESDIESYFVWIPRYSYKIWNLGDYTTTMTLANLTNDKNSSTADSALWKITGNNTRIIDVKFVNVEIKDTGKNLGDYLTHPAFTFGNKELNGIWIGKFEAGYKKTTNPTEAEIDEEDKDAVIIKPNVISWRGINVKNIFNTSYNYERGLDSHMLKNTEWGAVAYLSHSEYGIGTEVNINNARDFKTGYSAAPNTNQSTVASESSESSNDTKTKPWNTPAGYFASTSGNITGVYDMSGGAWEYVAAYRKGSTDGDKSGFSAGEITQYISTGYIDEYAEDSSTATYNKRILGDATGEMGPFYTYLEGNGIGYMHSSWYGDYARFVDSTKPWFGRGSFYSDGVLTGQFYFAGRTGEAGVNRGFRLVLSPTN